MTLHPAFGPGHSEYNPFLFAVAGEEELGLPLTVLMDLTRLAGAQRAGHSGVAGRTPEGQPYGA
jgi:hypothetical protein